MQTIKNFIEFGFGAALFFNAVLFLPQIIRLFKIKNGEGLSLLTFSGFCLIQVFVILHGFVVRDYLLIGGYTLSLVMCGTVTFLIVFYRFNSSRGLYGRK